MALSIWAVPANADPPPPLPPPPSAFAPFPFTPGSTAHLHHTAQCVYLSTLFLHDAKGLMHARACLQLRPGTTGVHRYFAVYPHALERSYPPPPPLTPQTHTRTLLSLPTDEPGKCLANYGMPSVSPCRPLPVAGSGCDFTVRPRLLATLPSPSRPPGLIVLLFLFSSLASARWLSVAWLSIVLWSASFVCTLGHSPAWRISFCHVLLCRHDPPPCPRTG